VGFEVFDYRKDIRNILVTPQIRGRFLRMEVGQVNRGHSHDLGHEIFLILQGRAEFEMNGESHVLEPGQLCVALTDESHIVRNVGDDEVIMYLSVTPHIQPTHTSWTEDGKKKPPRFTPSTAYDVPQDRETPTKTLAERHLQESEALAKAVETSTLVQREQVAAFEQALASGDMEAAMRARNVMWDALYPMFDQVFKLADAWNNLTYRTEDHEYLSQEVS